MRKKKLEELKAESNFINERNKLSKVDYCFLCGKKMNSACNSHVVPQFILKEIAENGYVSYSYALHKVKINGLSDTTGINNAYTFRLICKECDNKTFIDYENPSNIENFGLLDLDLKKKILCEMAIKTHLSHISSKLKFINTRNLSYGDADGNLEKEGRVVHAERIDIKEHCEYIKKIKKFINTNKNPFIVLYDKVLDYKTKLATQTIINYVFDLSGNQIFNPYFLDPCNTCSYFYLMILPYKDKTHILFYTEKSYLNKVSSIINQFNSLSDEDKLHFLFISLIIHDEQFYMTPSFAENIFKNDKKLVKLYMKTDYNFAEQVNIKYFKKYTNYLLKEYN